MPTPIFLPVYRQPSFLFSKLTLRPDKRNEPNIAPDPNSHPHEVSYTSLSTSGSWPRSVNWAPALPLVSRSFFFLLDFSNLYQWTSVLFLIPSAISITCVVAIYGNSVQKGRHNLWHQAYPGQNPADTDHLNFSKFLHFSKPYFLVHLLL